MSFDFASLPPVRGQLIEQASLAPYTWFRVGGAADALFLPADQDDLAAFLAALSADIPVTVLGVGSNVIVRDGGLEGVVIRLMGKYWGGISVSDDRTQITARAGALDLSIARFAAREGLAGLSFLSGIPGSIGGAVRTNAGCYGKELKDVLVQINGLDRTGAPRSFQGPIADLGLDRPVFEYRHTNFPQTVIVTDLVLATEGEGEVAVLEAQIVEHQARRSETQPVREKTGGSTFANPDAPGTENARSSWKLVDDAGCRGLRVGGAQVSELHCNFIINTGDATASDLEALGELVRARVLETSGVALRWEIRRIGRLAPSV